MQTTRVLRGLTAAILMLVAGGAGSAPNSPAPVAQQGAAPAAATALPFTLWDNRVMLPVMVNGQGPFQFILDTGAGSGAALSLNLFKMLGLHASSTEQGDGAGEATQEVLNTTVHSLAVGPLVETDVAVSAIDFQAIADGIGLPVIDGVLGDDLFRRYVVTVDYRAQRLWLTEPADYVVPKGAEVVPFTIYEGNIPVTDGAIEHQPGRFLIDLGDRSTVTLFRPFWEAHHFEERRATIRGALTGFGVGGPIRADLARMSGLELGTASLGSSLVRLSLQTKGVFADPNIAGSVGAGVLRRFVTTFDYPHGRLVLQPMANGGDQRGSEPIDRSGVWIGRINGQPTVLDVQQKSPGEAAGIRVGDIVRSVAGVPVDANSILRARERLQQSDSAPVQIELQRAGQPVTAELWLRELL